VKNNEANFPIFNRIYLKEIGFFRFGKSRNGRTKAVSIDLSSFTFIIEELISVGAVDIAVNKDKIVKDYLKKIPDSLRKRICFINPTKIYKRANLLFQPIAEEFEVDDYSPNFMRFKSGFSEKHGNALSSLYFGLIDFLVGLENGLQIEFNLKKFKDSILMLRDSCKNQKSRVNLATLLGLFQAYKPSELDSLALKSYAPERLISIFQEFVEDETYRKLSKETHLLGFPAFLNRTKIQIKRLVKRIAEKKRFKNLIKIASKTISVATEVPVPDVDLLDPLLNKKFLPPIISYKKARDKAYEKWKSENPDFQGYYGTIEKDIEWEEL